MYDLESNNMYDLEERIQQEKEKILELEKEVKGTNFNQEEDDNQFQLHNKLAEEYGSNLNTLRNENAFLKQTLEEKNKIIDSFQKVSIEAQEKMNTLINQNKKLSDEVNLIKTKLVKYKNEKKENENKKNMEMEEQIAYLKNELKNLNEYFNCQLAQKEAMINDLQQNCKNLQNQIQNNKKKSCLETFCNENNNPLNKCEEKYSFYKTYNSGYSRNPYGNC